MTECGCELCTTSAMLRTHNPAHGKASTYRHYACRCEACTRAASEAQKKTRANLAEQEFLSHYAADVTVTGRREL